MISEALNECVHVCVCHARFQTCTCSCNRCDSLEACAHTLHTCSWSESLLNEKRWSDERKRVRGGWGWEEKGGDCWGVRETVAVARE